MDISFYSLSITLKAKVVKWRGNDAFNECSSFAVWRPHEKKMNFLRKSLNKLLQLMYEFE